MPNLFHEAQTNDVKMSILKLTALGTNPRIPSRTLNALYGRTEQDQHIKVS